MGMAIFRKEMETLKKYVPGKPVEEVAKEYGITDIVKLASNENPLGPSPKAIAAIQAAASDIHIYPDGSAAELTEKLAAKLNISPNQIMFGNGGEEIIKMLAYAMINKEDEVIFAWPSFSLYEIATSVMGGKSLSFPMKDDFKHDFEAFVGAITDQTKMVYVCNPNNPTGNIMTKDDINYLVSHLPEHVVLVLDEAYFEFATVNPEYPNGLDILATRENTVIIRTFSKVAGLAGVRVGYMISSERIISEMTKVKNVFNLNRIAQVASIAALDDDEHIHKTVELNYVSIGMMEEFFDRRGLVYTPSNANFVWVNVGHDSRIVNEELLKRGVIIRPGFLWGNDPYLRVSTGTVEQTQRFIDALDDVLNHLN
jgi:histidinol-phosphate aminotransferase